MGSAMITRVTGSDLRPRIDPAFYAPEHLARERRLRALGVERPAIGAMSSLVTDGTHKTPTYVTDGVPFLSATNIDGGAVHFHHHKWISPGEFRQLKAWNCAPIPGDVLVAKSGTIGNAAVIMPSVQEFAVFESVAIVRCERLDAAYLAAFLNSYPGQHEIRRQTKGAVIRHLHLEDLREVEVPEFHSAAQSYIGDKLRQAVRLRERTQRLDVMNDVVFAPLVTGLPSPRKAWRVTARSVESYRLNPNHSNPVVHAALAAAKRWTRLVPIADLVPDDDIAGGATPLGAQYVDGGVFFARVQNVKPLRIDRSDAAYITAAQDQELARSRCREGDIVLTITGYPGTAAVVMDDDLPLNINQHSVRFAVDDTYGAGYVAAAINSRFGQLQVARLAVGGTRDALDYPSVRSLLVPELTGCERKAVSRRVALANRSVRAAQRLTTAATRLVESLIEGTLAEADLIAAQRGLEAGDREADRALLRSFRRGSDADAPALFPDVDGLYALLDETTDTGAGA